MGLCEPVYQVLDKIINLLRSIPFIILVALLIPATRKLMGTSIGVKGTIFPLVVATVPFFSRQIHAALSEIDPGMIRGATITIVNIVALTAMAGTVGGGGLGDYAIRYGYQRVMTDVTVATVIIILILVTIIQTLGTFLERKLSH